MIKNNQTIPYQNLHFCNQQFISGIYVFKDIAQDTRKKDDISSKSGPYLLST
jgi:hypothetical protein